MLHDDSSFVVRTYAVPFGRAAAHKNSQSDITNAFQIYFRHTNVAITMATNSVIKNLSRVPAASLMLLMRRLKAANLFRTQNGILLCAEPEFITQLNNTHSAEKLLPDSVAATRQLQGWFSYLCLSIQKNTT